VSISDKVARSLPPPGIAGGVTPGHTGELPLTRQELQVKRGAIKGITPTPLIYRTENLGNLLSGKKNIALHCIIAEGRSNYQAVNP
jgi:hypothetical protein